MPIKAIYIGRTGFTLHKRFMEHVSNIKTGQIRNAMVKHREDHHPRQNSEYEAESLETSIRFNMECFISEALLIEKAKHERGAPLLNQRGELGHFGITRLQVAHDR